MKRYSGIVLAVLAMMLLAVPAGAQEAEEAPPAETQAADAEQDAAQEQDEVAEEDAAQEDEHRMEPIRDTGRPVAAFWFVVPGR